MALIFSLGALAVQFSVQSASTNARGGQLQLASSLPVLNLHRGDGLPVLDLLIFVLDL